MSVLLPCLPRTARCPATRQPPPVARSPGCLCVCCGNVKDEWQVQGAEQALPTWLSLLVPRWLAPPSPPDRRLDGFPMLEVWARLKKASNRTGDKRRHRALPATSSFSLPAENAFQWNCPLMDTLCDALLVRRLSNPRLV